MEQLKKKKKIIGLNEEPFNQIKTYCSKNGLKIGWFTETTLLHYINNEKTNEK
jgi:hypothetical protein